ncbi:MAG: cytochrome c [Geminicoccaceae bacterium]
MAPRHLETLRRIPAVVSTATPNLRVAVVLIAAMLTGPVPGLVGTITGSNAALAAASTPLPASSEGRRLFLKLNCYGCHGMNGAGAMGPKLRGMDDDVSEIVRDGSDSGMPAFRRYVTTQDLTNLTAYIRSLGTKSEPVFTHWWEPYPSK